MESLKVYNSQNDELTQATIQEVQDVINDENNLNNIPKAVLVEYKDYKNPNQKLAIYFQYNRATVSIEARIIPVPLYNTSTRHLAEYRNDTILPIQNITVWIHGSTQKLFLWSISQFYKITNAFIIRFRQGVNSLPTPNNPYIIEDSFKSVILFKRALRRNTTCFRVSFCIVLGFIFSIFYFNSKRCELVQPVT
jgi:hypothetical protein